MSIQFIEKTNGVYESDTRLRCRFEGVTAEDMRKTYGEPDENSYCDPERGYSGRSWSFKDNQGNAFVIYDRYSCLRMAAHDEVSDETIKTLVDLVLHNITLALKRK